jgi:hypothetical protein
LSKAILDEIDRVLAAHYGFTQEELDLIPSTKLRAGNYDIKYRKGRPTTGSKSDLTYG